MKIIPYDEFLKGDSDRALEAEMKADGRSREFFEGADWCRANVGSYAVELVTCKDCVYSHKLHRNLFCRQFRRASVPETEVMVEETAFCSFAIPKEVKI